MRIRLCRSSATSIASGTASHNRVDPSISVNKKVTVPAGRSASPASPAPAGDGSGAAALIAGVPLVVVPLGRDQPGNAARVIRVGAGLRLRKNASVSALRAAVARVTEDPRYRAGARRMADRLAAERDDNRAIDVLEQVAAGGPATGGPATGSPARL